MAVRKVIETADRIHSDCQFYLRQINAGEPYNIAWRGIGKGTSDESEVLIKNVRLGGRDPKDTDVDTHNYINREFTELYGQPFRNALFMTGSEAETFRYGRLYQVFPIGQFKFIWSDKVRDLWVESSNLRRVLRIPRDRFDDPEEQLKNEQHKSAVFKDFNEKVISTYRTDDMAAALYSLKEIMVRCKTYYAVNFDFIAKNVLNTNKTYSEDYRLDVRLNIEKLFYKIVNNK